MDFLSSRRPWILAALAFSALAASPAAVAETGKARGASNDVEDLQGDIARPDDFRKFVDGSRDRQGDVDAPEVSAQGGKRDPRAPFRPGRKGSGPRPEGTSVPAAAVPAAGRAAESRSFAWAPGLETRKIAAVLGLGLMLIAGSWLETPVEPEADAGPEPAAPLPARRPRPEPIRPPEPELAPSRLANALAEPAFIDTRMPASTWRAISWREQRLIDGWDASREKSLGLASLTEWLDSKAGAEGVNVPLLKAKLFRDA